MHIQLNELDIKCTETLEVKNEAVTEVTMTASVYSAVYHDDTNVTFFNKMLLQMAYSNKS